MNQGSIFNCGFALVMNKRFISLFLLIFTLMGMMACQEKKAVSKQVKVELQSPFWSFNTSRTAACPEQCRRQGSCCRMISQRVLRSGLPLI